LPVSAACAFASVLLLDGQASLRLGLARWYRDRDPIESIVILPRRPASNSSFICHAWHAMKGRCKRFLTRGFLSFLSRKKEMRSSLPEGLMRVLSGNGRLSRLLAFLVRSAWMVSNMCSKGISFVLCACLPCMLPASLSGAGANRRVVFFHTNRPTQRLAAPATFPSDQQAVKRTSEMPLNVLRVASLEA
jgi:hypothetical protein